LNDIKTVECDGGLLKIRFSTFAKDEFLFLLEEIKKLEGRFFKKHQRIWTALPSKKNVGILKGMGFDFIGDAKKLIEEREKESVKITITNNFIQMTGDNDVLMELSNYSKYLDYRYCFNKGKFNKKAILTKYIVKPKNEYFKAGIGFLSYVVDFFKSNSFKYELDDKRIVYDYDFTDDEIKNSLHYLELYDYQIKAVRICIQKINALIKLPTSSGKTEIFLSLCKLMDLKTLILFSRIDLARQTLKRAEKANLDAGIVQGQEVNENHKIVMATVQSAHKLKDKYDVIIIDECHRSAASTYQKILRKRQFTYRFGFSATPFIGSDKSKHKDIAVQKYLGAIEYTVPAGKLVDQLRIAKPNIEFIEMDKPHGIDYEKWPGAENLGIVFNGYRNGEIVSIAHSSKSVMILIKKITHGELLNGLIQNSVFLYGGTPVEDREKAVKDFEDGRDIVLIASTIFDEGISINSIKTLIAAAGGTSPIKVIQRLGRGLRLDKDKTEVKVYDFWDSCNETLERHSKKRLEIYKKEGFEVEERKN
jgi:superfamily II DNA or RNA helicase